MDLRSRLIDREDELARILAHYQRAQEGNGNLLFIEGEAGVGKTRIVEEFLDEIGRESVHYLYGRGFEGSGPYLAFSKTLASLDAKGEFGQIEKGKVEQVFLIHDSSLLISHESLGLKGEIDADLLSGMLSVVQTFIRDSLNQTQDSPIKELRAGENTILIEHGNNMFLAVVLVGRFEEGFRLKTRQVMNQIGDRYGEIAKSWKGESDQFEDIGPYLRFLLKQKLDYNLVDPNEKRERIYDGVLRTIQSLTISKPVVLFIDDVQWADTASLELLRYITKNTLNNRIFLLGTFRPEDLEEVPGGSSIHPLISTIRKLGSERLYSRIKLKRLNQVGVGKMLDAMFPNNHFHNKLLEEVFRESDGNPFFVEEIMASIIEEGLIYQQAGKWTNEEFHAIQLPTTVKDVIMRRVGRLDKIHRKIIGYGSVLGLEFDFETIQAIFDKEDEEDLGEYIDNLISYKLIKEVGNDTYAFEHSTIQEVIYSNLSGTIKKVMHQKCGQALEAGSLTETSIDPFILYRHFSQTRDSGRSYRYAILSGERAAELYNFEEAVGYLESALDYLPQALEADQHIESQLEVLSEIANLQYQRGQFTKTKRVIDTALPLTEGRGDDATRADLLRLVAHSDRELGNYPAAQLSYKQAQELYENMQNTAGLADTLRGLGYCLWRYGSFESAVDLYRQAMDLATNLGDPVLVAQVSIEMGNLYSNKAEIQAAREAYNRAIDILQPLRAAKDLARVLNNLGDSYLVTKEWEEAIRYFERCQEVAEAAGSQYYVAWGLFNAAKAYAMLDKLEIAENNSNRSLQMCEALDDKIGISANLRNYGIIARKRGEFTKAIAAHKKGLDLLDDLNIAFDFALDSRELAETYLEMGDSEGARRVLEKALRICAGKSLDFITEELRQDLAPLLDATETFFIGHREELAELSTAYAEARDGHGSFHLLEGVAGIGKTALFEFWLSSNVSDEVYRISGECHSNTQDIPLYPFKQGFEGFFTRGNELSPATREIISNAPPILGEIVPSLKSLIKDAPPDSFVGLLQDQREQLFDTVTSLFVSLAREHGLILDFSNIHWIDPTSLQLLFYISRNQGSARLFLVASYTPSLQSPNMLSTLQLMNREKLIKTQTIKPFSVEETGEFIAHSLQDLQVATDVIPWLHDRTSGNPGLLKEILEHTARHVQKSDLEIQDLEGLQMPTSLAAMLSIKLAGLNPAELEVVQQGAVLGDRFELGELAQIFAHPEESLAETLVELCNKEILRELEADRFAFSPPALAEQVHRSIQENLAQNLHHRVLIHLEALSGAGPDTIYARAHHSALSGRWAEAIRYNLEAFALARQSFSHLEAEGLVRQAYQATRLDGTFSKDPELALQVLDDLLEAIETAGQSDRPQEIIEEYLDLSARFSSIHHRCHALGYQAHALNLEEQPTEASRLYQEAYELAKTSGDEELMATTASAVANQTLRRDIKASEPYFETYLQHALKCSEEVRARALDLMCDFHWRSGDFDKSIQLETLAIDLITEPANEHLKARMYMLRAIGHNNLDHQQAAITDYNRGLEVATRYHLLSVKAQLESNLAESLINVEDFDEAEILIHSANGYFSKFAGKTFLGYNAMQLGMIEGHRKHWEESEIQFTRALEITSEKGDSDLDAQIHYHFGSMLIERGDVISAEQNLREARKIWAAMGNTFKITMIDEVIERIS